MSEKDLDDIYDVLAEQGAEIQRLLREVRDLLGVPRAVLEYTVDDKKTCNCNQYRGAGTTCGWWCPVHGQRYE